MLIISQKSSTFDVWQGTKSASAFYKQPSYLTPDAEIL